MKNGKGRAVKGPALPVPHYPKGLAARPTFVFTIVLTLHFKNDVRTTKLFSPPGD